MATYEEAKAKTRNCKTRIAMIERQLRILEDELRVETGELHKLRWEEAILKPKPGYSTTDKGEPLLVDRDKSYALSLLSKDKDDIVFWLETSYNTIEIPQPYSSEID